MISGWKEFQFFDCTPVADPDVDPRLFSDPHAVGFSAAQRSVFYVTTDGRLTEFDGKFARVHSFGVCAHTQTPDLVRAVPGTRFVLTACSALGHALEVTVWDADAEAMHARCMVQNEANTFPLTSFDMLDDLSVLVFGFADGNVIAVRGDLLHDKGTRQRLVHAAGTSVTGLALSRAGDKVFVTSVNSVQVVSTTTAKYLVNLERAKGADLNCVCKVRSADENQLLVARESEVLYYNTAHRGASFELPVPKRQLFLTADGAHLVVVGMYQQQASLLAAETLRVLVIDLKNHLIAYNAHLANGVRAVFEAWGAINVLGANGTLYVLRERPISARIAALTAQNLYQVAIKMAAQEPQQPPTVQTSADGPGGPDGHNELGALTGYAGPDKLVLQLHQEFGDYLFGKRDVDGALREYVAAIPLRQTSAAIRRFKDSHHAAALLQYLQQLYARGFATPQHITLQIVCLTRLGQAAELERFLRAAVAEQGFDFERAIGVLMETHDVAYARLAAFLAEEMPDPDLAVQIRLRQLDDARGTLSYIQTVRAADALRILIQNARALLDRVPLETTGVLITLFTCKFVQRARRDAAHAPAAPERRVFAEICSYEAYIGHLRSAEYTGASIVSAADLDGEPDAGAYLPPKPRLIFPSFVGHDHEFVVFLEACLAAAPLFHPPEKDVRDIASALFETYLAVGAEDRASALVDAYAPLLDSTQVQIVSQAARFLLNPEQQVRLGSTRAAALRRSLEQQRFDEAYAFMQASLRDAADLDLCHQGLRQFVCNRAALEFLLAEERLPALLDACLRSGLTAAELLTELGASEHLQIKDVKPFILRQLGAIAAEREKHEKLAQSYRAEIESNQAGIAKQESLVFQSTACSACGTPLEPPAVHFGCKHSFHRACLNQRDCPRCLPEIEAIEALRVQQAEESVKEEMFFDTLGARDDKLRVVLDFISRGALSRVN